MKYWYFTYYDECVLCSATDVCKERRYTPKPQNADQRIEFTQSACGCHFC